MIKRIILVLFLSVIYAHIYALDFTSNYLTYATTVNGECSVTGTTLQSGNLIIPSEIEYAGIKYSVTSIGSSAFNGCNAITSVTIPNSVTSIDDMAFNDCTALSSVTIGNSVTWIGKGAFSGCTSLKDITIPSSVNTIYDWAFSKCNSMTEFTIEDGTGILKLGVNGNENHLLSDCPLEKAYIGRNISDYSPFENQKKLTEIIIGDNVTEIGVKTFQGCSSLSSVTIGNSVASIGDFAFSGCSAIKSVSIPNSVTTIGPSSFSGCSGLISITIPNTITGIGQAAFSGCSHLEYVVIPESVTSINNYTFNGCSNLTSVTIGSSVASIGTHAFSGCTSLTSVTIPVSVTSISNSAFYNCSSIKEINIEDGSEPLHIENNINNYSLFNSSTIERLHLGRTLSYTSASPFKDQSTLTNITIGNSVTSIGEAEFSGCSSLTSIVIPHSVTKIENNAFDDCTSLKEINIEDGTETLEVGYYSSSAGLFHSSSLEKIYLGRNLSYKYSPFKNQSALHDLTIGFQVTDLGISLFENCPALKSINIPGSVITLGSAVFNSCSGITSLNIPKSVISIGDGAFTGCTSMTEVIIEDCSKILEIGSDGMNDGAFSSSPIEKVYLGRTLQYSYPPFHNKPLLSDLTIGNSVESIGNGAFSGCIRLTEVTIPNSVVSIGESAFADCSGINILTLPNSITQIEASTFKGCSSLSKLEIPKSVIRIGQSAFSGCSGLTNADIPASITEICDQAFYNCTSIKQLNIEDCPMVLKIGSDGSDLGAFSSCPLEKVYLGRTLSYSISPFNEKSKLVDLIIGNLVNEVGISEFSGCSNLSSLTIPSSIIKIFDYAFSGCSGLTNISIPASVIEIGSYAFADCYSLNALHIDNSDNGLKFGDYNVFSSCPIETVYLGRVLSYSSDCSPFKNLSKLKDITIGNSVTTIGRSAFSGCSSLTYITIPASVTEIDNYAFDGCTAIKEVTLEDGIETLNVGYYNILQGSFHSCPIEKLYLGRTLSYSVSPFKDQSNLTALTIGDKVTKIGSSAFSGCSALPSITIPSSVIEIGNYAFNGCTAIKEVTLEDGEQELKLGYNDDSYKSELGLFYSCPLERLYLGRALSYTISPFENQSNLTILTIGEQVTSIGSSAFRDCSALASVTIPNSVTSIGSSAFYSCSALTSINIPSSITAIDSYTFSGCSALTSVTIPNSVTSIGSSAFSGCSALTSVNIPSSINSIDESAFHGCSALTSINIPASVTKIGNYAFNGCTNIKEVTLEDGIETLKVGYYDSSKGLFYSCPLEKLHLGRTLSYNVSPFKNQSALTALTIGEKITAIGESAFSGCSAIATVSIPNSVTSIGSSAFLDCSALTSITIPASVTEIGNYAFNGGTAIKEVTLEDGEQELKLGYNDDSYKSELGLFYSCPLERLYLGRALSYTISPFKNKSNLTSLTIGDKVTTISESTFSGCSGLTSITIPASVTEIGDYAFTGCTAIKEVTLEDGELELKLGYNNNSYNSTQGLFHSCPVEKLYLGRALSYTISPFKNKSNLTALTIGDKVSSISESAFYGCSALTTVTIPNAVTSIGSDAFSGCSTLASVTIGNSVTEIGSSAFSGCKELTSITLPESINKIGNKAFYGCTGLTSVTLPAAVTKIGAQAFGGIELTEITALGNVPSTITDDTFSEFTESYSDVWVPAGTFSLYKTAWPWLRVILETGCETDRTFAVQTPGSLINMIDPNKVEMITSLKLTGQINGTDLLTMNKMKNLKSLDLSEATIVSGGMPYYEEDNEKWGANDNTLGEYWSYNLPLLTKIILPKNLEQIGEYAFSGKKYLEAISIPASVKSIGYGAFSGCTSVKELRLEDSAEVLKIWGNSFYDAPMFANCPLEVLHLGRDLSYHTYPFSNRSALHTLTIGNTVTSIPDDAFSGCTKLTAVIIPNSVTEIGSSAFSGCSGLEKITIPDPVTSIRSNTFDGCSALTEVTLPGSLREIGSSAFGGTALTDVYVINPVPPVIQEGTFPASVTAAATLHVPEGSEGINWIHPYWGKFANIENWIVGTQSEFVAENVTYHITSEADATVEISAAALTGSRAGGIALTIPASVTFNGKTYRVAGIANNGFENCAVESVELPATIGYVGLEAFKGCANLTALSVKAELPPSADVSSFDEAAYATVKLSVPESSKDAYSAHAVWGKFSLESIPNNPTDPENPDDNTDAIVGIAGDTNISVSVESGAIIVTAPEGTPIEVYGMSGARVRSTREHRIDGLTRGVYIVRIGTRTFKVAI